MSTSIEPLFQSGEEGSLNILTVNTITYNIKENSLIVLPKK